MHVPHVVSLLRSFVLAALFLGGAVTIGHASIAESQIEQAQAISRAWLAQIDAGKYEESYNFACDATHDKFPQDHWVAILDAMRGKIYGAVVTRTQTSHVYKPNGIPGLSGECVVITYATSFHNVKDATETVVLTWQDGKWRGADYIAQPKEDADAPAANAPQTEVHTESHVAPTQAPAGQ